MPQYLFGYMWDNCPQELKNLAHNHTFSEENPRETLSERVLTETGDMGALPPRAVLLFDYCYDFESLEDSYLEQNPEVTKVEISTVKFLPQNIFSLIPPDIQLFANNM